MVFFMAIGPEILQIVSPNRNRIIKISLGCTHLQRHSKALQHFIRAKTHGVDTHDFFFIAYSDQFHFGWLTKAGESTIHRGKCARIDLHLVITILLTGIFLGQANSTNGRVTEDNSGNVVVIQMLIRLVVDHKDTDNLPGLVTIGGGKLMTYRLMAEMATDVVANNLGNSTQCTTVEKKLPGAAAKAKPQLTSVSVPVSASARYRHGERADDFLKDDAKSQAIVCECEMIDRVLRCCHEHCLRGSQTKKRNRV